MKSTYKLVSSFGRRSVTHPKLYFSSLPLSVTRNFSSNIMTTQNSDKLKLDFSTGLPSHFARDKTRIKLEDCWAEASEFENYKQQRKNALRRRTKMNQLRRMEIGPHCTLCFESYDTMWIQIHEMIYIEKAGKDQFPDEIDAYSDLVPQGNNLTGTFMIEVDDKVKRLKTLYALGHVEDCIEMHAFGDTNHTSGASPIFTVKARPLGSDRTSDDGKTSAVHFLSFDFTAAQISQWKNGEVKNAKLVITHPNYRHSTSLSAELIQSLSSDFK